MMNTTIEKRRALPHNKDMGILDVVEIWMSDNGSWEWFIIEKRPNDVLYGLVFSPFVLDGEFGSVYKTELINNNVKRLKLSESMAPTGYSWECVHGSIESVSPSIADISIEESVVIELDQRCIECKQIVGVVRHGFKFSNVTWTHTCTDNCKHLLRP